MVSIEHVFFGVTLGFSLSPFLKKYEISNKQIAAVSALGSIGPDIDWLSIFFNKEIYFGFKWYSHHSFSHSILGCLLLSAVFYFLLVGLVGLEKSKLIRNMKNTSRILLSFLFCISCLLHVLCDMVTIPGLWDGVPILAPFAWERYGGWSFMAWRNYFLIFLAVGSYFSLYIIAFIEKKIFKISIIPVISFLLFSFGGYTVFSNEYVSEKQWEKLERRLVGNTLYEFARNLEVKSYNYFKVDIKYGQRQ